MDGSSISKGPRACLQGGSLVDSLEKKEKCNPENSKERKNLEGFLYAQPVLSASLFTPAGSMLTNHMLNLGHHLAQTPAMHQTSF